MSEEIRQWDSYSFREVTRDSQRRKVYKAEWAFRNENHEPGMAPDVLRTFLRSVVEDYWFRERFGKVRFNIIINWQRKTTACCSYNRLKQEFTLGFPAGNGVLMTRMVALHELAHIVTHRQLHGPIFCSVFLHLVIRYMGETLGKELLKWFKIKQVELCV